MLIPFYMINADWALAKAILVYFEMETCHQLVRIPLIWVCQS